MSTGIFGAKKWVTYNHLLKDCNNPPCRVTKKERRGQSAAQPSECKQQHTMNIVYAQTAAQQQSNGSYEARMSGKCGEWRDEFIMTLSPIHWVPVQNKGSKILCVKLGAMKAFKVYYIHLSLFDGKLALLSKSPG